MTLLLVLLDTALAADCPSSSQVADLTSKLDSAEKAYASLEVEQFTLSLDEAALMLPCLGDPVTPALGARYHRTIGLRLFIERDRERASQAFAAARAIDPTYEFPDSLIPTGHAVRAIYGILDASNPQMQRVADPVVGHLTFDGTASNQRPSAWPTIAQILDASGVPITTAYLFPADPMPAYDAVPLPAPLAGIGERRPLNPKPLLFVGGGVAAVASGVLYALAASSAQTFDQYHEDWTLGDLETQRGRTNTLVIASIGSGVLAVGAATGGVLIPRP